MTSNGFQELLELHSALSLTSNNRIKCNITGHEMVPKREVVLGHINGKKFTRLSKEWSKPSPEEEELKSNQKFLVPHKKKQTMLYCKLTGRSIKNETIHIQRHVRGKKFKKSLDHWNQCEKNGQKFRPMNLWGSIQPEDADEDEELELDDRAQEVDDTSDLHPWKANEEQSEEAMEEDEPNVSGHIKSDNGYVKADSDAKSRAQQRKMKRTKNPQEKSVPVRRKTQKMEE